MAIEIWEKFDSPHTTDRVGGIGSSAEFSYVLKGSNDDLALRSALKAHIPTTYFNLVIQDIKISSQLAPELWLGEATYGFPDDQRTQEPPETGDSMFTFDITGSNQHITQSLATTKYGTDPPDYKGAIGVTKEGVEGVDILIPQLQFGETHYLPGSFVTLSYVQSLKAAAGKTNSGSFRGFDPGEVLFLGASGTRRGRGDWEVSFTFSAEENKSNLTIGDIASIAKPGHAYLWVAYEDEEDSSAKIIVKRPRAVYVEQVYESTSFSSLGI